jgi:hypothetical protein
MRRKDGREFGIGDSTAALHLPSQLMLSSRTLGTSQLNTVRMQWRWPPDEGITCVIYGELEAGRCCDEIC